MTSLRQIDANRRNARLSTGPVTESGKKRSRRNALRHGLIAETVIGELEDASDYAAFEGAIKADFDPQTAVERELVLRLSSLLWRLRRATAIETGLFRNEAQHQGQDQSQLVLGDRFNRAPAANGDKPRMQYQETRNGSNIDPCLLPNLESADAFDELTRSFVQLARQPTRPLDRLHRYEAALWRQSRQILLVLARLKGRRPWERKRFRTALSEDWSE
jgi:hypothetical protein